MPRLTSHTTTAKPQLEMLSSLTGFLIRRDILNCFFFHDAWHFLIRSDDQEIAFFEHGWLESRSCTFGSVKNGGIFPNSWISFLFVLFFFWGEEGRLFRNYICVILSAWKAWSAIKKSRQHRFFLSVGIRDTSIKHIRQEKQLGEFMHTFFFS